MVDVFAAEIDPVRGLEESWSPGARRGSCGCSTSRRSVTIAVDTAGLLATVKERDPAVLADLVDRDTPVADPVAFALSSFGRIGQWTPVRKGQIMAYGRKPWLASRLPSLLRNP